MVREGIELFRIIPFVIKREGFSLQTLGPNPAGILCLDQVVTRSSVGKNLEGWHGSTLLEGKTVETGTLLTVNC